MSVWTIWPKSRTYTWVISSEELVVREWQDVEEGSCVEADDGWKPLVVDDVLHDGDIGLASFLVQTLVVPLWVDTRELRSYTVVLTHEEILDSGKTEVLIRSSLSSSETLAALVGVTATSIGRLHQERTSSDAGASLQLTSLECSELSAAVLTWSVDLRAVDE